jgi:hypothetical protein
MEIEYALDVDDLIAYHTHNMKHSAEGWVRRLLPLVVVPAFLVPIIAHGLSGEWPRVLQWALVGSLFTGLMFVLFPRLNERGLRRSIQRGDQTRLFCSHRLTLTPSALTDISPFHAGSWPWNAVDRIDVTDQHLFVFTAKNVAHVVPRRVFASEQAFEEFVETARRYFSAAHRD